LDVVILLAHAAGALVFVASWIVVVVSMARITADRRAIRFVRDENSDRGPVAARGLFDSVPPTDSVSEQIVWVGMCAVRFTEPMRAIFVTDRRSRLRGVITWSASQAEVVVRHSWWHLVYMRAWLTGWFSAGSVMAMYALRGDFGAYGWWVAVIVGLGGAAGYRMYRGLLSGQRSDAGTALDELTARFRSVRAA